ncbi:hypothetical protein D8S78_10580 [Natrialba swarupiae]|nr:hypothetical protein [Natrialba swarupiae]
MRADRDEEFLGFVRRPDGLFYRLVLARAEFDLVVRFDGRSDCRPYLEGAVFVARVSDRRVQVERVSRGDRRGTSIVGSKYAGRSSERSAKTASPRRRSPQRRNSTYARSPQYGCRRPDSPRTSRTRRNPDWSRTSRVPRSLSTGDRDSSSRRRTRPPRAARSGR